jgi:hypothetical protein
MRWQLLQNDSLNFTPDHIQAHLLYLRLFCSILDVAQIGGQTELRSFLQLAVRRYERYLDLLADCVRRDGAGDGEHFRWPLPPHDVAMVMHSHLLSTEAYWADTKREPLATLSQAGFQFPLLKSGKFLGRAFGLGPFEDKHSKNTWKQFCPDLPYNIVSVHATPRAVQPNFKLTIADDLYLTQLPPAYVADGAAGPKFKIDLVEAVLRQREFAQKITAMYRPSIPTEELPLLQENYAKFMALMVGNTKTHVPTLTIDLVWHTHQLVPDAYRAWCVNHIGRAISHDDTIETSSLSNSLAYTSKRWETTYGGHYIKPEQTKPALQRENASAPTTLTPEQVTLWEFDVAKQDEFEQLVKTAKGLEAELAALRAKKAPLKVQMRRLKRNPPPSSSVSAVISSSGSSSDEPSKEKQSPPEPKPRSALRSLLPWCCIAPTASVSPIRELKQQLYQTRIAAKQVELNLRRTQRELKTKPASWRRQRYPLLVAANDGNKPAPQQPRSNTAATTPADPVVYGWDMYPATWYYSYYGVYDPVIVVPGGGCGGGGFSCGGGCSSGGADGGGCGGGRCGGGCGGGGCG